MLKMARLRTAVVGSAVVLLAGGLTACQQTTDDGDTTMPEEAIKIMTIAAEGSGFTNYPDVQAGARAAVEEINGAGGVDGRPLELIFCNTRGEANQAMACARDAVSEDVVAVVGSVDIFTTQSVPILAEAGIPNVGAVPISEIDYLSPASFPMHSGNYGAFAAAPAAFLEAGFERMVTVRVDFEATAAQAAMVDQVAAAIGMENAGQIIVPAQGVTDYAPYAQQIKDRSADAALVLLGPQGLQALFKAAESLGIDTQFAGTVFSFGESEAQAIGTSSDGIWVLSPFTSPRDTVQPGVERFVRALANTGVADDDLALHRSAGLNSWLAVHAFAEIAAAIDGTVDRLSMTAALEAMGPMDVEGLLTWDPSAQSSPENGVFERFPRGEFRVLTFKDGKLVPTDQPPVTDPLAPIR